MASHDEVIPPGQAGKVTATIRTENLRGPVQKTVTVSTDDPARSTMTLMIRANLVGSVTLVPSSGVAITARQNPPMTAKVLIRKDETEKGELRVSSVTAAVAWLQGTARKVEKEEPPEGGIGPALPGDWILDLKIAGDPPSGFSTTEVRFKTGLPREPEVAVPVNVRVLPELILASPLLYLPPPSAPGATVKGSAMLTVRPDLDPVGLKAEAEPPAFRADLESQAQRTFRVGITWTPAGDETPREGRVIFRLGSASAVLRVLVSPSPAATSPAPAGAAPAVPPPAGK